VTNLLEADEELRQICREITSYELSEDDWAARESDDMFQSSHYCGGFDADERAFCFSYYSSDPEQWFQLSLAEVAALSAGGRVHIGMRVAG
jgi:hypothetical protein